MTEILVKSETVTSKTLVKSESVEYKTKVSNYTKTQVSSTHLLSVESPQQVQIKWLDSGKPVLEGLERQQVEVSLSHDERFCLCVVGSGPQGCDIVPVTHRSQEDWISLLSRDRKPLLNQLLVTDCETIDVAGTRLWAAIEALRKAFDVGNISLSVDSQHGDTVLFRGTCSALDLYVMTFPISLTSGHQRMVALIVNKNEKT